MYQYSHPEPHLPHKKSHISHISSFATPKIFQKSQQLTCSYSVYFRDVISLRNADNYKLTLQPKGLYPCAIQQKPTNEINSFCLFVIEPIRPQIDLQELKIGQEFYLLNKQSRLYLSAEREISRGFTGVCFKQQPEERSIFYFTNDNSKQQANSSKVVSQKMLKLRNKVSQLEVRIQSQQKSNQKASIWLTESGQQLFVSTVTRDKMYKDVINNKQTVLISFKMGSQINYVGVSKHRGIYFFSEKREPMGQIEAQTNMDYFSKINCQIAQINPQLAQTAYLFHCLWQVQIEQHDIMFPFLAKSNLEVRFRHFQTGLYLSFDRDKGLLLQNEPQDLILFNSQRFKCDFSEVNRFQPLYYQHPLQLVQSEFKIKIEVLRTENRLKLFLDDFLLFLDNLIALLCDSEHLNKQQFKLQIKKYIYLYKLLSLQIQDSIDGGFFYFEFSLKILEVLSTLLSHKEISQGSFRLLKPLMEQIARYMCVVAASSEVLTLATSKNTNKKTKQIINLLFVLYNFSQKFTLSLLLCVSTSDPQLIINMLAERLIKSDDFQQRVTLLMNIKEVINQARRINIDEQILFKFLRQQHELQVQQKTLILRFQGKTYNLQKLLQDVCKLRLIKSEKNDKQKYYFILYLLYVMKILYEIYQIQKLSYKDQKNKSCSLDSINLSKYLVQQWEKCELYEAKIIIVGFVIEMMASLKLDIHFPQQRFVVWKEREVTEKSLLNQLLQLKEVSLDWLFNKQQFLKYLEDLKNMQVSQENDLVVLIKYLTRIVDLCSLLIATCTFDIDFLNKLQDFGLSVSSIHDEHSVSLCFREIKKLIYQSHKTPLYLADRLKFQLDILLSKLIEFFNFVLACKKRLYIHPFNSNPQTILLFSYFKSKYAALLLVPRFRNQMLVITNLLEFYRKQIVIQGIVLKNNEIYVQSMQVIERVVQSLQGLSIIMESFKLYQGGGTIKQNLIASIKLKILNIQQAIKSALTKNAHFQHCSEAFDFPGQLLNFILQNYNQYQLVSPLAELLFERINITCNIFTLLRQKELFIQMLQDPNAKKTAKLILRWIGKQIQLSTHPPPIYSWISIFENIQQVIETQEIGHNLLWFIGFMCELGLKQSILKQRLYAKLNEGHELQQFIQICCSNQTMKTYREKMLKDVHNRNKFMNVCFEMAVIFKLCKGNSKLEHHVLSLLSLKEIIQFVSNCQDFQFLKILVSYITISMHNCQDLITINQILLFCLRILREYSIFDMAAINYSAKMQDREREGHKAFTLFSPKEITVDKRSSYVNSNESLRTNYWELLMEIPCYCQPQGILVCLQTIIKQILKKGNRIRNVQIQDSLNQISEVLHQMKDKHFFRNENIRIIKDQIKFVLNLFDIQQQSRKSKSREESEFIKRQVQAEQLIYKFINENELTHLVLTELQKRINNPSLNSQNSPSACKNSELKIKKQNRLEQPNLYMGQSQSISVHQHTHHSLIIPQRIQYSFITSQQKMVQSKKPLYSDKQKNIIQFLENIRKKIIHRNRLIFRLELLLSYFFRRGGSFECLYLYLCEQANLYRIKATEYKQEVLDYQISFIRRQPDFGQLSFLRNQQRYKMDLSCLMRIQQQMGLNPKDINKIQQVLDFEYKEQNIGQCVKQLLKTFKRTLLDLTQIKCLLFDSQTILSRILYLSKTTRKNSVQIEQSELKNIFSSLLYRFSLIEVKPDTLHILMRIFIIVCQSLCFICGYFPLWAKVEMRRFILNKLQLNSRQEIVRKTLQIVVEHECKEEHFIPNSLQTTFPYLLFHFEDFVERIIDNKNMEFYTNLTFIKKTFDFLQLRLTINNCSTIFPITLLKNIIRLELRLYSQIFLQDDSVKRHYEQILLMSLTFFHSLSLQQGKLISNTLYSERQHYLDSSFNHQQCKEIYDFYQKTYEWCILNIQGKRQLVQAFPAKQYSYIQQQQLKRAISNFSQINIKRQILINYTLGSTIQTQKQEQVVNKLSVIAKIALIISYLCIIVVSLWSIFLYDKDAYHQSIFLVSILLINLLILCFLIFYKLFILVKMGNLQIKIGNYKNLLRFFLNSQKSIVFYIFLLLVIAIYSFILPGVSPLLFFEIGLLVVGQMDLIQRLIKNLVSSFGTIVLLSSSLIFCLTLTINPQRQTNFVLPIFDFPANFDIRHMLIAMRIWTPNLDQTYKASLTVLLYLMIHCMVIAFSIYHFITAATKQALTKNSCHLCTFFNGNEETNELAIKHVNETHNVLKFLRCFKYILLKRDKQLSLQQQQVKQMLIGKDISIFG